jgi:hypothetical protein
MQQSLSWSFNAGTTGGHGVNAGGALAVDAVFSASIVLDANMAQMKDVALQIDDVDKLNLLVISSSLNDGKVELKADGSAVTMITGPLVLFGNAAKLFAGDLEKISLQNKSADKTADISILIGLAL